MKCRGKYSLLQDQTPQLGNLILAQKMKLEEYSAVTIASHDEILENWHKTIGELKPIEKRICP